MTSSVHPIRRRRRRSDDPPPVDFNLLQDTGGAITRIALRITDDETASDDERDAYNALFEVLAGRNVEIVAVAEADDLQTVTDRLDEAGASRYQVISVQSALDFQGSYGIWMRDCLFSATQKAGGTPIFLHAPGPIQSHPKPLSSLPLWLSSGIDRRVREMDFLLDGGSSLTVDDDHWIVGAEGIEHEMDAGGNISWSQAIEKMATGMDRPPIVVGSRFQDKRHKLRWLHQRFVSTWRKRLPPDLHDKKRLRRYLIVAWTGISAAYSIVRDLLTPGRLYGGPWSHIDMVVSVTGAVCDSKPVLLVGDSMLPGCPPTDDAKMWKAELDSLAGVIDEMKTFCVIRNPTPCVGKHLLGCNNTIVQTNPNVVLLPVFTGPEGDFSIVDQKNFDIWHGLGFDVVKVPGWMAVYKQNGCIRCATLPLERELRTS